MINPLTAEDQKICLSCMECCKWLGFVITPTGEQNIDELIQMYRWRGCEVKHVIDNQIFLVAPSKCQHLTVLGCSIYHTRPAWCRRYDGRTDPALADKCKLRIGNNVSKEKR